MFKNSVKNTNNNRAETIIGPSVKVNGNFHGDGDIIIEGEVEGNVKTKNTLTVNSGAKIIADVIAKNAKISGSINGNVKIDNCLELEASAKIAGDISCKEISVAKGAIINGHCQMGADKAEEKPSKA
ncbi:MAG: polymer-forming cytoskeletal protein [Patescibacteria group bacterium]|nr:polymer-forming cytoskeletal protein [Patescibacteria group bacterium]